MKKQLEQFDAWLRQPGALGIPRWIPIVLTLITIGAVALTIIRK